MDEIDVKRTRDSAIVGLFPIRTVVISLQQNVRAFGTNCLQGAGSSDKVQGVSVADLLRPYESETGQTLPSSRYVYIDFIHHLILPGRQDFLWASERA